MSETHSIRAGSSVLARLNEPTASSTTLIAVLGDPHLSTRASGTPRRFDRTEDVLQSAFDDINRRDVDLVVSVGDLTKDGAPWDFDRFDELLETLESPFLSVPGNHDVPRSDDTHEVMSLAEFTERYTPGTLPFHEPFNGIDVLGLNTAAPPDGDTAYGPSGHLSDEQCEWFVETLDTVTDPLVVMHHNLPAFIDQRGAYRNAIGSEEGASSPVGNADKAMKVLVEGGASLVLTGHRHRLGLAHDNGITEISAPALPIFPQGYYLLVIDDRGTTVRYVPFLSMTEAQNAYVAQLDPEADSEKTALSAIHLSQFPLREEWVPPSCPE